MIKWQAIPNYDGLYEVSTAGEVRSVTRKIVDNHCVRIFHGKLLNQTKSRGKQPYLYVSLSKNGKAKKIMVHRIVALTFIKNPENKPQVNHIDGNVHNNNVENLEWATNAENTQHAYDLKLNIKKQLHIEYNGEIKSLRKWCRDLGLNYKRTWHRIKTLNWTIKKSFEEGGDARYVKSKNV